ncbi:PLP-dependent transferase [Exidia glandulosa HHB12029]|uniref:sphinganine-1-phosphate aldolase n=1 Tax=Exidia glandulosa HHB12029 TaxID=1314781 RepID=A0A165N4R5_EXIGL|nr:PLP-dependent transferase [Exidia glandulosa HHB12029]
MDKVAALKAHIPPVRTLISVDGAKNAFIAYFVFTHLVRTTVFVSSHGIVGTARAVYGGVMDRVVRIIMSLPSTVKKVEEGMQQARIDIEARLVPSGPGVERHLELPAQGKCTEWILAEMDRMDHETAGKTEWKDGHVSGAVYHGGEDMERVIVAAFEKFVVSNPLHPDVFPAVRKMEAEVVSMCLRMYNHPDGAGTMTSGGTESILMAVKAYRDWARDVKGITEPEMVIPASAHAAFDKAGAYFKIKVHHIPVDPVTRQVPIKAVKRAVNWNTIMVVGSAINFPDGCMDDIVELGKLAKRRNIGLHVDCCLGSFIMPFLERAGFPVAPFDFRVEGVTSISCDTHKYGFAPKGSSVVMYRSADLRKYQYYVNSEWPGGVYASPSISGSRPGSLIAGTWAAMQYMGQEGYLNSCREIVATAKTIENAIRNELPELFVLGKPVASVVAFGSKDESALSVLAIGDLMSARGWHLNALMNPPAVHIACTRLTVGRAERFITDLKDSLREAKERPSGASAGGNMVTVYGLGHSTAVGPRLVQKLATVFLDTLYKA